MVYTYMYSTCSPYSHTDCIPCLSMCNSCMLKYMYIEKIGEAGYGESDSQHPTHSLSLFITPLPLSVPLSLSLSLFRLLSLSFTLFLSLSLSLSLVARNANFYYADQRVYNGHYVDAIVSYTRTCIPTIYCPGVADTIMMSLLHHLQRNGKGTMTWPNKSCYVVRCTCTCIHFMYT